MKFCDKNQLKNLVSHTLSKDGIINCDLRRKEERLIFQQIFALTGKTELKL